MKLWRICLGSILFTWRGTTENVAHDLTHVLTADLGHLLELDQTWRDIFSFWYIPYLFLSGLSRLFT